jgi:hypothetical protein
MVNGVKADSTKTANYLRGLARLSNSNFIDDFDQQNFTEPTYSLNISTSDLQFIELKGYIDSTRYVVHSSENPEAYFDGNSIGKTIFVGKAEFQSDN